MKTGAANIQYRGHVTTGGRFGGKKPSAHRKYAASGQSNHKTHIVTKGHSMVSGQQKNDYDNTYSIEQEISVEVLEVDGGQGRN